MILSSHSLHSIPLRALVAAASSIIISAGALHAQEVPELVTDRPDQTESAEVVPPGWVQIETGVVLEKDDIRETLGAGTTLVRFGTLDNLEFRVTGEYTQERVEVGGQEFSESGLAGVSAGVKLAVAREGAVLPQIAFIAHLQLPVGHEAFRSATVAPEFRFALAKSVTETFGISANVGAEWDGSSAEGTGVYTLALGLDLSESFGAYGEVFGSLAGGMEPSHMFDAGITFQPVPNLQLDVSAGVGITEAAPDHYLSAGVSLRLPR